MVDNLSDDLKKRRREIVEERKGKDPKLCLLNDADYHQINNGNILANFFASLH